MEFQFQRETFSAATTNTTTTKQGSTFRRNTSCGNKNSKYVGVRQRPSGKWVAEIKNTTQKIRMWLGTFDTAEEAARAYDEAACLLRGNNTRTNFIHPPANSSLSFKIRNLLNQKKTRASKLNLTTTTTNKDKAKSQSSSTCVCTTSSSSSSNSSSSQSSKDVLLPATTTTTSGGGGGGGGGFKEQMNQVFDGAYKPDLSYCCIDAAALEWGFDQYSFACEFDDPFLIGRGDYGWFQQEEEVPKRTEMSEPEIPMFEHMKVERQISASFYAMNGVNQYWDNVHDTTGDASLWDLSHMFCPS